MARVIIELDPMVISKLEALAREHGRVLQAELKFILETAAQSYRGHSLPVQMEAATKKAILLRQQLARHVNPDDAEPQQVDIQNLFRVIEDLKLLKQKVSLTGLPLQDLREEGRRF